MFPNSLSSAGLGGVLPEDQGLSQDDSSASTSPASLSDYIILLKVTILSQTGQCDLQTGKVNRESCWICFTLFICCFFF